ncbi:MAG: hypothetical protein K2W92_06890 [Alphaproteobacteria bacterium]|nr:hypothetical protein [Alphaproteobacteria bacterium]
MNIYLHWPKFYIYKKKSLSIFNLEIIQEENYFATARLMIDGYSPLPPTGTEGLIQGDNEDIFFKGELVGAPIRIEGSFREVELIAKPFDFSEKMESLQKKSRIGPYWDKLWVRPEQHDSFAQIQGARTASLYCDRKNGHLSWSDWFEGCQTLSINQNFFQDSLQMKLVKKPLKSCTVNVHAHWIQSESGVENLSPSLRRAFPLSKVSTYTKNSLFKNWPVPGKRLGRSGVWILKSKLNLTSPSSPLYPHYSPSLCLLGEEDQPQSYRLQRYWFTPILWVGWQYQQKRKETLNFTLHHTFQPLYPGESDQKVLNFTLQNINPDPDAYPWRPETMYYAGTKVSFKNKVYRCHTTHRAGLSFEEDQMKWTMKKIFHTPLGNPARSSFFLTDRGHQAAEHAMERGKVELAKSARALEVFFEGPWEVLKDITTDTTVILSDPRLPGDQVKGKVVKYTLSAKGETGERFVQVTLLCSVGTGKVDKMDQKGASTSSYALENDYEEMYQVNENTIHQTPSGLPYFTYADKTPLSETKTTPFLRGVELINGPEEQEMEMIKHIHKTPSELKKALSQKPTRLKLFFKDLRTKEIREHVITVRMASTWSAPQHVVIKS